GNKKHSPEACPHGADEEGGEDVGDLVTPVPAEGDVDVADEPVRHRGTPSAPELRRSGRLQHVTEVRPQTNPEEQGPTFEYVPHPDGPQRGAEEHREHTCPHAREPDPARRLIG